MRHGWDAGKAAGNLVKHGVAFEEVERFGWERATISADLRSDYGEVRLIALGLIGTRMHVLIYTIRRMVWVISLRKANKREVNRHEAESRDADG